MSSALSEGEVARALEGLSLGNAVQHYPVALTTTSVALGWLRQRGAGHGSLVLADTAISPTARLGGDLGFEVGFALSIILEPPVAVDHQDILWAHGLLALSAGLAAAGIAARPWWPEFGVDAAKAKHGSAHASTQLSANKIESTILTLRFSTDVASRIDALVAALARIEELMSRPPAEVADEYRSACVLVGEPVTVRLMPSGSSGGLASSIDERGGFGVGDGKATMARHAIDQIRSIGLRQKG
ncbi:MAG: hypothetical protein DWQ20_03650 [Actinobacteria bacterium]|nr:MAG: hypothetical protein DWQ20_03650 [Actinomycetota bacterium]